VTCSTLVLEFSEPLGIISGGMKNEIRGEESSGFTIRAPEGGVICKTVGHIKYVVFDFHSSMRGTLNRGEFGLNSPLGTCSTGEVLRRVFFFNCFECCL